MARSTRWTLPIWRLYELTIASVEEQGLTFSVNPEGRMNSVALNRFNSVVVRDNRIWTTIFSFAGNHVNGEENPKYFSIPQFLSLNEKVNHNDDSHEPLWWLVSFSPSGTSSSSRREKTVESYSVARRVGKAADNGHYHWGTETSWCSWGLHLVSALALIDYNLKQEAWCSTKSSHLKPVNLIRIVCLQEWCL